MKSIKAPLLAATSSVMLAMAMTASADAIPFRDDVGDEGAQQFAQGWDGVVQIYLWNRVSGQISFNCTGSMINARTVISAAHCFDAYPEQVYADGPGSLTPIIAYGPDTFVPLFNWINTGQQFVDDLNGLSFGVDLMMHPDSEVNGVNTFPAADVAMIALSNPLYTLPTYGMLFSPIPEDVFNEGVLVNQIGYGTFHPGSDSSIGSINGRRRAGENMLGLLASQSDFFQALAGEGAGSPVPSDNQLLYWTDFDLPGRTGTCTRANLGPTGEDSIFCDDNVPGDGVRLDGDTVVLPGPSIDYFPGDALPNEVATGGGDSGGPLMAMNLFNNPLILGVLSGGFVDGFFHSSGQSYGEVSYYNPLFTYHQWISENNPYKYVSAMAGDGLWSDGDHWVQGLDPNYFVYNEDGEIVNGLPDGDEGGLGQRRPIEGIVFDTPVADTDTGDNPAGTGAGIGGDLVNFAANGVVATLPEGLRDGAAGSAWAAPEAATAQTVSGLIQTLTGPGYTGFVPSNYYGRPNAPAFEDPAQFFDVTLAAAGTTTFDLDFAEIDNLTLAGGDARLVINEDTDLTSLIGVNVIAGELEVNGGLLTRELMLWTGMLSGSGIVSLFDLNAFVGNGQILDGALFNVGGVVTAGAVGQTGSLTIQGDYIQTSGGVLGVDWSADGADLLVVNGDVSLGGLIAVNPLDGYVPTYGDTRRILSFAGERVGEFDGDNLPGVLYLATTYGAGFVNVTVEAESFSTQAQFQNGAQSGIAARLDNAREGSYDALSNLYAPIDVLSGEDLTSAFENLVPHEHYQLRRASEAHLELFANQMRDVALGQGRAEASGQAMAAGFTARLMGGDQTARLDDASLAIAADQAAGGPNIQDQGNGWRLFGAAGATDGELDTTNVSSSELEGSYGFVGFDYQTRNWLRVGATLGYANSEAESLLVGGGQARSDVDTLQVGVFALAQQGGLTAMLSASHAGHTADSDRTAVVGGASFRTTGGQDGHTNAVTGALAYDLSPVEDALKLTPIVSATWSETRFDAGEQSGSVASMTVDPSEYVELVGRVGLAASTQFRLGAAVLEPRLYAGIAADARGSDEAVIASLNAASGPIVIDPVNTEDNDWSEFSLGVTAHLDSGLAVAISYDSLNDRRGVLDTETLSVGARFRF
ncbi:MULTISPECIES: autotransporter domain-containing protein [unclassified Oceanicaulis]|uniref:autotransporter domain-containing protein n=1 Tax=unclassified Oceanicaulis TaxID=2632123 RepID=UPI0025EE1089|nr:MULTISPECIES: autotransporter domain-containing protein [unclassified Oceanicaulis]